jgi:hypothetical protein
MWEGRPLSLKNGRAARAPLLKRRLLLKLFFCFEFRIYDLGFCLIGLGGWKPPPRAEGVLVVALGQLKITKLTNLVMN